jgi:hypothetical protein
VGADACRLALESREFRAAASTQLPVNSLGKFGVAKSVNRRSTLKRIG